MLFAADVLAREPGATVIYDVKSTRNLKPWILRHGGVPLLWKTGHSLIKGKMKEVGAALAGEMSGHTFFKERWYGFDDGLYAGARLLEILSRHADPSAVLDALPDAVSTPELNVACAEGEHHALVAKLGATAQFPGRDRRHPHRRPARRVSGRLRPRARVQHHAGDRAALRGRRRRGARAHQGRVPARARGRQARHRAAVLTRRLFRPGHARRHRSRAGPHRRRRLLLALRRIDPAVAAHRRARLVQARLPAAHRELQGTRRAQRAAATVARTAPARRDRRVRRQPRAGHRLPREAARHSDDRRDARVRGADQGHQLPPVRRRTSSCTAPT